VAFFTDVTSREPTTGGQYHWVSVFAPVRYRKVLSYMVGESDVALPLQSTTIDTKTPALPPGWMCALGWQSAVAGSSNVGALSIQGFIFVINGSYHAKVWHLVLLTIAILVFVVLFNIFLAKKLPGIEGVIFVLYLLGFVGFLLVLFIMGDRSSAKTVFTEFQDNAGWGSIGTACFVSISGPVITIVGSDSAVHLAEELKDASRQLPRAMVATALTNYFVGFVMLLAFIFVVGNVEEVLASPTGLPYIQVIWNATQSRGPTVVLVAIMILSFVFTTINVNVTASRQIWAFARDGGLPFSGWISYVSQLRYLKPHIFLPGSGDMPQYCAKPTRK
jgi:choline transport protein